MSTIGNISSSLLNQLFTQAIPSNPSGNSIGSLPGSTSTAPVTGPTDQGQLSPLGLILSTLQQLQQSNPTQYQQVTQQIATNLKNAAGTAQKAGNTTLADQLNQLATDFSNASSTGQLPNIQDLAKAAGGHHHHHGHHAEAATATTQSSSQSSGTTSTNGQATDPLAIILQTLDSQLAKASAATA